MKKFELNVVSYNNEDVIATSGLYLEAVAHYTVAAGNHFDVYANGVLLTEGIIDLKPNAGDGYDFEIEAGGTGCDEKLREYSLFGRGDAIDSNNFPGTWEDLGASVAGYYTVDTTGAVPVYTKIK